MKQADTAKPENSWGVVPVGASRVPVRWIVMWFGIAGWLTVTFLSTGAPTGITALALNLSFLIGLMLIGSFTRSIPVRTIGLMFFSGAVMMGVAFVIEAALPPAPAVRPILVGIVEEALKMVPLLVFFLRARKFSIWTLGVTDVMLMGAASGAGFAFVFDAFRHVNTPWVHKLQWLPTADFVNSLYLVSGHAVWTAIAGATLGAALMMLHNRKIGFLIGLAGFAYAVIDHIGALTSTSPLSLSLITARGFATPYVLVATVVGAVCIDTWVKLRWFPKASEFRLPKRGDSTSGLTGLWDFVLDRRRLANANYKRMHLATNANASMAVAILSQSLINHHSPPKMAKLFANMGMDGGETMPYLPDKLPDNLTGSGAFVNTDSLDLPEQYQLIARISVGGMGAIYKSRHRKTNALLAIKILHPHVADVGSNRQRFDREAKAAAALKHPNLVVVHDYGITARKVPYLVMELIDGSTLQDEFGKDGGLPPSRFFNIFDQVCAALIHAHSRGVIHRDIKPSNILIVKNSETPDMVKVVDFGIAKVIDPRGLEGQELTQTGDILGSPLYMSPEQCMGESLDERTDIYSLGCVMYQGITGKPPLLAENVVKTIFKHVNVVPDPISVARPDIHLPPIVEQIIFRTLEKKPSNRFASMEELRSVLQQARQTMG